jgi:hypothetical protein
MLHPMNPKVLGLQLEFLWYDDQVLKVRAAAWNGQFGGTADVYLGVGGLAEAAAMLEGFPTKISDCRQIEFGGFGPESAGGAIAMRFSCKDGAGHALVEVRVESDHGGAPTAQSAVFIGSVEATAIDTFVAELRSMESKSWR